MNRIRPLDPAIVNLIAAGEVVERPALAIKELVENSLDAAARGITVELRDGGLSYFRVTDNGAGIPREELALAFARSATSKLRAADDLTGIATMGFRGEALASIAAVSKVTLTSRARGEDSGAAIVVEGGRVEAVRDAASPEGTTVVVKDIFYNVPARRKFLKKPIIETAYATDWIIKLAAAWPDVSVRLINQGRQTFRSAGDGSARGVLAAAWGLETSERMIPVKGIAAGCVAEGFVGVGEDARYGRAQQWLFLNRRAVRAPALADAVELACRERILIGRSPIFALWLTMDYAAVDVNVHPNKLEVRFGNERDICDGIVDLVADALRLSESTAASVRAMAVESPFAGNHRLTEPAPMDMTETPPRDSAAQSAASDAVSQSPPIISSAITPAQPRSVVIDDDPSAPLTDKARDSAVPDTSIKPAIIETEQQSLIDERAGTEASQSCRPFRVFGAAFNQYILVEQGEVLFLIDQHAAHERFLYDRFMAALDTGSASQPMLSPLTVELSHREAALIEANAAVVAQAGFTVEPFGERAIRVTSVPMVMGAPAPELIRAVIDALDEFAELPTARKRRDSLIQLSCKKAIKGGDPLTNNQIEGLLSSLANTHTMPTCPHGRPICVAIEKRELDRRFKRIV
ncbi:MAG: DNA mismatch repair endonuclease MutL [Oscillospiraceae bacterium]|jgi:DNA mismatch repair protein MutL|nr:DNA mismatch repair endonuclease MutL [Oscillospiraceae bacterium]